MPGTTVRIREETRRALRELEEQTGERATELLARAVDQLRRDLILAETNAAYARPNGDEDLARELDDWDGTLADGLEDVE